MIDARHPESRWPSVLRTVGRDVWGDWGCAGPPLVSPDQGSAACVAVLVQEAAKTPLRQVRPHWSLWLFDLEEAQ